MRTQTKFPVPEVDMTSTGSVLEPQGPKRTRVAPPKGVVTPRTTPLALTRINAGGRVNTQVRSLDASDRMALASDGEAQINLDSTLSRYNALGVTGVITSSFRSSGTDYAVGGSGEGDHTRGLALDVSYGNYADTREAFNKLIAAASVLGQEFIRQIIFENVRGTPRGYHIHIGFYPPEVNGKIISKLWFSKKDYSRYKNVEGATKYHHITEKAALPPKEVFENA